MSTILGFTINQHGEIVENLSPDLIVRDTEQGWRLTVMGGSWQVIKHNLRSYYRHRSYQASKTITRGFRCVKL